MGLTASLKTRRPLAAPGENLKLDIYDREKMRALSVEQKKLEKNNWKVFSR